MNDLPSDVGAALTELRQAAQLTQSDLAPKVGVDQSRISRIEKGDLMPSGAEVKSYLKALATKEASNYLRLLEKEWRFIKRPHPRNPEFDSIWSAERQLQRLDAFEQEHTLPNALRAEINMHRQSIYRAADFLGDLSHDVSFVGDIGVGKTTALCFIAGLLVPGTGAALDKVALETGGGGTTVCEVQVKKGPAFGIVVQPEAETEIYTIVGELCAGLKANNEEPSAPAEIKKGVSRELDRALRNMAGLARKTEKTSDGKRVTHDPAAELAKTLSLEELRSDLAARLRLWERTTREMWYEESPKTTPLKWIRDIFVSINNGRLPKVSLPRRIDVLLPESLLPGAAFTIGFVDTKGVDDTAIRPDLKARLDDARTLTVLCSSFNSAPDTTMQRFIEHAIQTGSERTLTERVTLLVLPRPGEARAMKDDSGQPAETDEDGYQLKTDQVQATLKRIGADGLPIRFFNAITDEPAATGQALLDRIVHMRQLQAERIASLEKTINNLIKNHEIAAARAVRQEVIRQLSIFIKTHRSIGERLRPVHHDLITAIQTVNARSVWATARRQGQWHNLDIFYYLGAGAATDAKRRVQPIFQELQGVLTNMLGDPQFETGYEFLNEVRTNSEYWREQFLEAVKRDGQETFRPALQDAAGLWADWENRWGGGPGYRHDIAEIVRTWFEEHEPLHRKLETKVRTSWRTEVLGPLRELCNETAPEEDSRG
jgi:transcriptional regulator with XRE-family HTH domain